jgi:hypothetical protein
MQRINPLDGVVLPDGSFEQEMFLRRVLVPRARSFRAELDDITILTLPDKKALTHLAVGRMLGAALFPLGKPITADMSKCCAEYGIRIVAEAFDLPGPAWAATVPLGNDIELWLRRNDAECRRVLDGLGTDRECIIADIKNWILKNCGPERDAGQFHASAKSAMASLGLDGNESGASEEIDYVHTRSAIALVRGVTSGTPGGIFRGRNGKIQMGEHQFRDIIAREYEISREDTGPQRVDLDIQDSAFEPEVASNTVGDVHDREFEDALMAFKANKLAGARKGDKKASVLEFFDARFLHGMEEKAIADATGSTPAYVNMVLRDAAREFADSRGDYP